MNYQMIYHDKESIFEAILMLIKDVERPYCCILKIRDEEGKTLIVLADVPRGQLISLPRDQGTQSV